MMVGLEKGVVKLVPYAPEWQQLFEAEKASILDKAGGFILDIQHVGSTSIPGMVSKPIIDIGIAVANFEEARVCITPLEQLGYEYRGEFGIPLRHYFSKGDPRTFHLHMAEITSTTWQNLVLFRDYLVQHPDVAQEYATLKLQLAEQYPRDRDAYLEGKASFVGGVLEVARVQAA